MTFKCLRIIVLLSSAFVLHDVLALGTTDGKKKGKGKSNGYPSPNPATTPSIGVAGASGGHPGPYQAVGEKLPAKKKPIFFTILKKMREAKNNDKLPEVERNATRKGLNDDMHKLLGDALYQQYRSLRVANTKKIVEAAKANSGASEVSKLNPSSLKAKKKQKSS